MRKTKSLDRAKLVKVLARLDSQHPGEALGAARLAARMMRDAGLEWSALIDPPPPPKPAKEPTQNYADWTDGLRRAPRWRVAGANPGWPRRSVVVRW